MTNWKSIGVSAEGAKFSIQGLNVWDAKWERSGSEVVELPHPSYPTQMHRMNVYQINTKHETIVFAAGELSANVWGFYTQEKK